MEVILIVDFSIQNLLHSFLTKICLILLNLKFLFQQNSVNSSVNIKRANFTDVDGCITPQQEILKGSKNRES